MPGFHRPARAYPPIVPEQRVALPAPPTKPSDGQSSNLMYVLMPLLSSVSMAAFMISVGRWWMIVLGVVFVVLSVGVTFWIRTQLRRQSRRAATRQRDRYLEYLTELDERAREHAVAQRAAAAFAHPGPSRLWALTHTRRRLWERRPDDEDFLTLRLGTGWGPAALRLEPAGRADPLTDYEPHAEEAGHALVAAHSHVAQSPAWVDVAGLGVLSVVGDHGGEVPTTEVLSAVLMQLAVLHAPDDVRVAAVLADPEGPLGWAKWLPHAQRTSTAWGPPVVSGDWAGIADVVEAWLDAARKRRGEAAQRLATLSARNAAPPQRLVVVLDGYRPDAPWAADPVLARLWEEAGPAGGVHVVCSVGKQREEPQRVDVRARVGADGGLRLEHRSPALVAPVESATADRHPPALCEQTARALCPLRLQGDGEQVLARAIALPAMMGVEDLGRFDPAALWREPDDEALLRMPIGLTGEGDPLVLDLKESAQGGVGPHGLVVGATGSGKSELLRTLVTGLTMAHPPEQLSFVLVDFKGGATFAGVTELPHVAGLITNLADDLALVDRMRAALAGEQQRRQQMLRDAGDVDSVREYQLRHAQGIPDARGRPLEPMPYMMIIVDEFGELLSQRPDFIDLFVQIGRVGRSLGMHLLLATQRLEEGRLRGLDSHLSYRVCLRTFSPGESRAVIGTPDAYRLPGIPGSAYLKVDESVYERFRVAWVSSAYTDGDERPVTPVAGAPAPRPFGLRTGPDDDAGDAPDERVTTEAPSAPRPGGRTEMHVAVERIMTRGATAHQVWLPPLPPAIDLDSVAGPMRTTPERGYHSGAWPAGGGLCFPVGVLDLPAQQQQCALVLDLSGRHGHLAVVGAPQSGKSTLLRSALLGAMTTHTPDELRVLAVDFGGGTLAGLEEAPHVSGVATRHDPARSRRALAVAAQLLEQRERLFARLRIDAPSEFRRRRDAGELPEGVPGADVVLVLDNWAAVRAEIEEAEEIVAALASRGLGVGIHLLLTANRWPEIRAGLRDNLTGRLELRQGDAGESEISRPLARQLRDAVPGRGIVAPGHVFHTVLPRLDGRAELDGAAAAQQDAVARIASAWTGACAPELQVLPELITWPELDKACAESVDGGTQTAPDAVPIGVRELDLQPALLDLAATGSHFLVLGDSGSGKTDFLRSWIRGLARRRSAAEVRFVLVDVRRSLFDVVEPAYVGALAADPDSAAAYVGQVATTLDERRPPADVSAAALRERAWWTGPEIYVVVDDYDLVAGAGQGNPLAGLVKYLPHAADLGFHLVLARRVGGMSRTSMGDPVVSRMRDLAADGLVLSGDPREGVLLGDQRASRRPPGRGVLVSRSGGAQVVQTVHDPVGSETPSR